MGWRIPLPLLLLASCVLAAPADIHDIRGPIALDGLPPFVLSGGVLLLIGGLWLLQRKRRRPESAPPPPGQFSPTTPGPDANDLLTRLVADYRQGTCPNDQIVIRLDEIVRGALAATTGIAAQRRTAAELSREATACLNEETRASLDALLSLCDRVKFAGHRPARAEIDWALHGAARLFDGLPEGRGHALP